MIHAADHPFALRLGLPHLIEQKHPAHHGRVGHRRLARVHAAVIRLWHQRLGADGGLLEKDADAAGAVQVECVGQKVFDAVPVFAVFDFSDLDPVLRILLFQVGLIGLGQDADVRRGALIAPLLWNGVGKEMGLARLSVDDAVDLFCGQELFAHQRPQLVAVFLAFLLLAFRL